MIAEVALNVPLRRTFDYIVPEAEQDTALPGCRVIVPFGRRLLDGIVVARKESSDIPPEKLKEIQQTTEVGILFPEELLNFTRWISNYYFCGWGEALDAALPTGLSAKIVTHYKLRHTPVDPALLHGLSTGISTLLESGKPWDMNLWQKAGATPQEVKWLRNHAKPGGAILMWHEYGGTKTRVRMEKWVQLTGQEVLELKKRPNPRKESRRDQVLRLLRTESPLPLVSLKAHMPGPAAVVKKLAEEGLVEVFEKPAASRFRKHVPPEPFLPLNEDQTAALAHIRQGLTAETYNALLLQGVTGSGKTEVYLHAARETLALGKTALLLVPEIALTESIVNRFRARFGEDVAVLHSGMAEGERFDEWRRVHEGQAKIVVGARSAVFAPLDNIGLVVVDEEHDNSYKQDDTPRYNGRDAAMMRARSNNAVVVLGSATPSLEAIHNVGLGKLTKLELPSRILDRPMPEVEILDLKKIPRQKGCPLFSLPLVDALRETLERKEQAMLFLNRRGFAHLVRCKECEEHIACEHCSITLTYHQAENRLRCHRCDYSRQMPEKCPACDHPELAIIGLGTQRLAQDLALVFPEARILRMDSDSLRRRGELERMLTGIREHEYDFVIGTQILSKGHDFPRITLVGAVLADVSLNLPDFRSAERTFQVLTQMAGRAGRGETPGRVIIQTYSPDHYSLECVRTHDTEKFCTEEMTHRQDAEIPPITSQALLWISGPHPGRIQSLAQDVARRLHQNNNGQTMLLGPAEAPIKRISDRYRWMIQLRAKSITPIHKLLWRVLEDPSFQVGHKERVVVDIDPYNVM